MSRMPAFDGGQRDTGWINYAGLANGWVQYDVVNYLGAHRRMDGIVYLAGLLKSGTVTAGTTLFTLPVGHRPAMTRIFPVAHATGTSSVYVLPNGQVQAAATLNATWTSLDGISFLRG